MFCGLEWPARAWFFSVGSGDYSMHANVRAARQTERSSSGHLRQIAPYTPTEEEIAAGTAAIRETWDEAERARRAPWAQPVAVELEQALPCSRRNDQFVIDGG
jgi:hypothetical protein